MTAYRVAVIVLNYRGKTILPPCLASLSQSLEPEDRLLVVDNGNEEELMRAMQERFPRLEVLSLPKNIGFAGGMNAGIRQIETTGTVDAYWLLNNDTIIAPDALRALKAAAQSKNGIGLFSPLIRTSPYGPLWFAGGKIDFFRMKTIHFYSFSKKMLFPTEFLTGCALFIPISAVTSLGLFDERYFLYAEDAEYSLRAKRRGIPRYVMPDAVIYHSEESEKNAGKLYWLVRSSAEFFFRESRGAWWVWVRGYYILRRAKNRLKLIFFRDPLAQEVERAYTDVSL